MGKTLTLQIPDELYQVLKEMADSEGRSPEDLGTAWLSAAIERTVANPLMKLAGFVDSDTPDLADNHDDYLAKNLLPEQQGHHQP